MTANRQRFNQRQLLELQTVADVKLMSRQNEFFAHAAVAMDADDLKIVTAIRATALAGVAVGIVHVRFDATAVANFDIRYAVTDFYNFHTQFMAGRARKLKERKFTQISRRVSATDANAMDLHFGIAGTGRSRSIHFNNSD